VLRLGAYAALVELNVYVYSRQYRRELSEQPLPMLLMSGGDDPVTGFGRTPGQLADFYRRLGWDQVETRVYPGSRHEVFHDELQAKTFDDCLGWIENRL
jgi:alpha-beta hydrolase superfamily lysophospholipase